MNYVGSLRQMISYQLDWLREVGLWLKSYYLSQWGSLDTAVLNMIHLNIYARNCRDRDEKRVIYGVKTRLIQLLYDRAYCVAARKSVQELPCWGTWNYDCGPHCPKCDGTGIYARHELYRFTFNVNGRRFTWHQPADLVTWPVALIEEAVGTYEDKEEGASPESLAITGSSKEAMIYAVWWTLRRYGRAPRLPLFNPVRYWHWRSEPIYYPQEAEWFFLCASLRRNYTRNSWEFLFPQVPLWGLFTDNFGRGGIEAYWCPNWFGFGTSVENGRRRWSLLLFGRHPFRAIPRFFRQKRREFYCWRHGHDWRAHNTLRSRGQRCRHCGKLEWKMMEEHSHERR